MRPRPEYATPNCQTKTRDVLLTDCDASLRTSSNEADRLLLERSYVRKQKTFNYSKL